VTARPVASLFKPGGIRGLAQIVMSLDEFEAIRLSDAERLRQAAAAARMKVSRPTYGRIVRSARRKLAMALVRGLALRIAGDHPAQPIPASDLCPFCPRRCDAGAGDHCASCDEPLVRLPSRRRASG
jgi:predicted DNA-binding protein (UPF0251 family)